MKPEDVMRYVERDWSPEVLEELRAEVALLPFDVEGQQVLDLAAGTGSFSSVLLDAGAASVVWHDIDPTFRDVAQERLGDRCERFELRDMLDLPYGDGAFDLIVIREALGWASNESELLHRLSRITRPGGWLVIIAHNWRRPFQMVRPWWKVPVHLVTPHIGLVARSKPLPTLWVFESLTRRRLRSAGFDLIQWKRRRRRDFVVTCRRHAPAVS